MCVKYSDPLRGGAPIQGQRHRQAVSGSGGPLRAREGHPGADRWARKPRRRGVVDHGASSVLIWGNEGGIQYPGHREGSRVIKVRLDQTYVMDLMMTLLMHAG
jgi:hypothetical protein